MTISVTTSVNSGAPPRRVVLLPDVDGVLAPTGGPDEPLDVTWHDLEPGATWFYTETIDRFRALTSGPLVDTRWLTTWHENAPNNLAPALGLGDWNHYDKRDAPPLEKFPYAEWWKERVVRTVLATGARVVWVDDQISWRTEADLLELRFRDQLLLVEPDEHRGLTVADIDGIEAWIRAGA